MFKNLFFNKNNRHIYKGNSESATPIKESYSLPTQTEAKTINKQESSIRQLEREAKNNASLRFYMYGY